MKNLSEGARSQILSSPSISFLVLTIIGAKVLNSLLDENSGVFNASIFWIVNFWFWKLISKSSRNPSTRLLIKKSLGEDI